MKKEIVCPLGSQCEQIVGDQIETCAWYVTLAGPHPQTGEILDEQRCAMAWIPVMLVEVANTNRGQTAALESMRNKQTTNHKEFMEVVKYDTDSRRALGHE